MLNMAYNTMTFDKQTNYSCNNNPNNCKGCTCKKADVHPFELGKCRGTCRG